MKEFRAFGAPVLCLVILIGSGLELAEAKDESGSYIHPGHSAQQRTKSISQPGFHYVGNSFSAKFHKPECEFVRKMRSEHVKLLKSKEEGTALHYRPCNWCLPTWDKSVTGTLVKPCQ